MLLSIWAIGGCICIVGNMVMMLGLGRTFRLSRDCWGFRLLSSLFLCEFCDK